MYDIAKFLRMCHTFLPAHLNRVVRLDSKIELPKNSTLHILDNMNLPDTEGFLPDFPLVDASPLIVNERYKKYIYTVKSPVFSSDDPIKLDEKPIFITTRLDTNIMSFRQTHGSRFILVNDIENLPDRSEILPIINYNPLFRMKLVNKLARYRKMKMIWAHVFNNVNRLKTRNHYILIPVTHDYFSLASFRKTLLNINQSTLLYPENAYYLFLVNFFNFVWSKGNDDPESLLKKIPNDLLSQITIVLHTPEQDKAVFYTLSDILKLNEKNRAIQRIINQINLVSTNTILDEDLKNNVQMVYPEDEIIADEVTSSDTVPKFEPTEKSALPDLPSIDWENELPKNTDGRYSTIEVESDMPYDNYAIEMDVKINAAYNKFIEETRSLIGDILKPTIINGHNTTKNDATVDENVVAEKAHNFIADLDDKIAEIIENQSGLSQAQKDRLYRISQKYKECELNGRSIETIIISDNDVTIEKTALEHLNDFAPDKSMTHAATMSFDNSYIEKSFQKDLASVFVGFATNGMFLTEIKEEVKRDELNSVRNMRLTYEDVKGKKHSVKLTVPLVDNEGHCYINGVKKLMKKQMYNLPICKVSDTRVTLTSSYNKTMVERNTSKAHSFITQIEKLISVANQSVSSILVTYGNNWVNTPLPYEYSTISKKYFKFDITAKNGSILVFVFDYNTRKDHFPNGYTEKLDEFENKYGVFLGTTSSYTNKVFFMGLDNKVVFVDLQNDIVEYKSDLCGVIMEALQMRPNAIRPITEWVETKVLSKNLPVIFLLGYRYGLTEILKYLGVKYETIIHENKISNEDFLFETEIEKEERSNENTTITTVRTTRPKVSHTNIVIRFKDRTLIFNRYPFVHSLIVGGLDFFDLREYEYALFDERDVYYALLMDKRISINYLKGIDGFFDLFVDPITRDTLEQMGEPTNLRDLLIRATSLLTTEDHNEASSLSNFRVRSYERIAAIAYNSMARGLAAHNSRRNPNSKFSINPNDVYQQIIQEQAMIPVDAINPIHDIKEKSSLTYTGMGGRTDQSFVLRDRKYPPDAVGVISEAVPDGPKVAINTMASMDAAIANTRGMFKNKPIEELEPSQILSVTSLLMPGATNDD